MPQITKEKLLNKIKALNIESAQKDELLAHIQSVAEVDGNLIDWLKDKIQVLIDENFTQAGITDDENNPEYQAKFKEMMSEIDAAEKEFNEEMDKIGKKADKITEKTAKQLDNIQTQTVKDQLAQS